MSGDVLRRITEAGPADPPGGKIGPGRQAPAPLPGPLTVTGTRDRGTLSGRCDAVVGAVPDVGEPRESGTVPAPREGPPPWDPSKGRFVVTETVAYYPAGGDAPLVVTTRFSRPADSDEQPYARRLTLTEQWVRLDTGYLGDKVSAVVVENHPPRRAVAPSPQERAADRERVVELSLTSADPHAHVVVRPGEDARLDLPAPAEARLRCRKGTTKVTVTAFPA